LQLVETYANINALVADTTNVEEVVCSHVAIRQSINEAPLIVTDRLMNPQLVLSYQENRSNVLYVSDDKANTALINELLAQRQQQGGKIILLTQLLQQYHNAEKVIATHSNTTTIVHGNITNEKKWKQIASFSLIGFALMIVGYFILSYFQMPTLPKLYSAAKDQVNGTFVLFMVAGFIAQLVDGIVGMGYGVTSTSILMSMGVHPAAISGSVHTAEIFSSGVSGYSHYKFGNVNKKLFKVLVIPGVVGTIIGAVALVWLGDKYGNYLKPFLAVYCMILGIRILYQAIKKNTKSKKVKRAGWLAGAGGFLDSFGGGGWGPLVTSTLIAKGRSPQYVIGSVSLSEFFITLGSAVSFFALIGITHWQVIIGLMIGGGIAAPIAAKLAGKLPVKKMLVCVGIMVILWSVRILIKFI
jgi:uncharacterized protein